MFVKATNNINIRMGSASTSVQCTGYIPIGQQIEIVALVAGDEIDGNSVWYKSVADQYLWSGGFSLTDEIFMVNGAIFQPDTATIGKIYESAVKELISSFFETYSACTGLGVGYVGQNTTAKTIVAYVDSLSNSGADAIPSSVNYRGVKLRITLKETGGVNALVYHEMGLPVHAGGGTCQEDGSGAYGTRTAMVYKDDKNVCFVITCYHVACYTELVKKITAFQSSSGSVTIPAPFVNSNVKKTVNVTEGYLDNQFDYALMALNDTSWLNNSIPFLGAITGHYSIFEIDSNSIAGMTMQYFGAKTNAAVTCKVRAVSNDGIDINFKGYGTIKMYGLVACTTVAQPGDSGAPVVDDSGKLLGHVVGADIDSTYVLPFAHLSYLKNLNLLT